MTPRSSGAALVLLLALAAACLLGSYPDRTHGWSDDFITWNHMTVAENLSPEHHFLGFYRQQLDDEGRRSYVPYNRFPVFGHLLIKLVTLPFPDDSWARLRAARLLMLAFHAAAALLAWLALRRLMRDPWTALTATLLAFSSFHSLYFADMVATEGVVGLFGLLLAFHGMAVFATEGRFGQLAAKTCVALLLDWHVYALVGPFVALGLAAAWRRGDGRAARRCLTLGAVAVLFGLVVLGTNFAREYAALGGETPLTELPSVRSALRRTSIVSNREYDWPGFAGEQFNRIGLASVPWAVSSFAVDIVGDPMAARYGTPSLVALSALVVLATLALVVRPAAGHRLPLAALALSGPCWAVAMRNNVSVSTHEFEGMFYAGVPLALFALTLPRLDRLLRRAGMRHRVTMLAGAVAAAIFVLSGLLMARTVHDPERADLETLTRNATRLSATGSAGDPEPADLQRMRMTDSDAIRELAEGKTAAISTRMRGPALTYYFRGLVQTEFDKRRLADFVVGDRLAGVRSLTPNNRSLFLYDLNVYEAALTRYERRANAQRPVVQSPDYDIHFVRNEREDALLYVRRECPAAMDLWRQPRFFLHVYPVSTNDLPAERRRHGFDNRDFTGARFWRGDGKCYSVSSLPDYAIASIHTGQFTETREGARYDQVWASSFSLGDLDGAGGAALR